MESPDCEKTRPMRVIGDWFKRILSDPQFVILGVLLVVGLLSILFLGKMLAPVFASVIVAYLLEGLVNRLQSFRVPRMVSVVLVFSGFMCFLLALFLGLLPLLWRQAMQLFQQLPGMIAWSQEQLLRLPERYPAFVSDQQILDVIGSIRSELSYVGQRLLSLSLSSVRVLIWILVYIFLMPLLVFFFLKDKDRILGWVTGFIPEDRMLASKVWHEVDEQMGNYVRGKSYEILIIWAASYLIFTLLGLEFAVLLGFFVGLSVLVPYFGATFMVLPVALVAYFQWGWCSQFAYVVLAYIVIQILDGNVLVTILFSEVVNLHPIAIIIAILFFGGIFGFWGVFFAIPLATLVKAILNVWPRKPVSTEEEPSGAT